MTLIKSAIDNNNFDCFLIHIPRILTNTLVISDGSGMAAVNRIESILYVPGRPAL
jgi:hypothetical protein